MQSEAKSIWLTALRSGEYPQSFHVLHRTAEVKDGIPIGYCCLGVFCKAMGLSETFDSYRNGVFTYNVQNFSSTTMLPVDFAEDMGIDSDEMQKLITMNDCGKSFEEIANWIEENL